MHIPIRCSFEDGAEWPLWGYKEVAVVLMQKNGASIGALTTTTTITERRYHLFSVACVVKGCNCHITLKAISPCSGSGTEAVHTLSSNPHHSHSHFETPEAQEQQRQQAKAALAASTALLLEKATEELKAQRHVDESMSPETPIDFMSPAEEQEQAMRDLVAVLGREKVEEFEEKMQKEVKKKRGRVFADGYHPLNKPPPLKARHGAKTSTTHAGTSTAGDKGAARSAGKVSSQKRAREVPSVDLVSDTDEAANDETDDSGSEEEDDRRSLASPEPSSPNRPFYEGQSWGSIPEVENYLESTRGDLEDGADYVEDTWKHATGHREYECSHIGCPSRIVVVKPRGGRKWEFSRSLSVSLHNHVQDDDEEEVVHQPTGQVSRKASSSAVQAKVVEPPKKKHKKRPTSPDLRPKKRTAPSASTHGKKNLSPLSSTGSPAFSSSKARREPVTGPSRSPAQKVDPAPKEEKVESERQPTTALGQLLRDGLDKSREWHFNQLFATKLAELGISTPGQLVDVAKEDQLDVVLQSLKALNPPFMELTMFETKVKKYVEKRG